MAKLIKLLLLLFLVVLFGCGTQSGSSSDSSGSASSSETVARLSLSSDVESILSNGVDEATLTARALDSNNVAIEDASITFSTTGGALSDSTVPTDSNGYAIVYLDSGLTTSQEAVTVTASSGSAVATETINILGTTVTITSDKTSVGLSGASTATISVRVLDGSGNPVENESIVLESDLGTLDGSSSAVTYATDSNGRVTATFAGGVVAGVATVTLTGPATETISILISDSQFTLSDSASGSVNITGSDNLTLTWIDESGTAMAGETVIFNCTQGTFGATNNNFISVITDSLGQASVTYYPGNVAGIDSVSVGSSGGLFSDSIDLVIYSDVANSISVNVNPSVVARSINGNTSTATVSATVLDSSNRAVQGTQVAFSLFAGPSGGESITPAIATTNVAGIATATFTSGGLISAQEGVIIKAIVVSDDSIFDTAKLTIADQAATIVIGGTNKILTLTIGDAEAAYALPFTVLVTDTNGSAIENQEVALSVFPTQFMTGFYVEASEGVEEEWNVTGLYPNEDLNRNGNLDAGEDFVFNNGRLDPGGVVSIVSSVTTDENGFAGFNVVYAKDYGNWVDVEITATTNVSGTESTAIKTASLAVEKGDTPYLNSPFNVLLP